MHNSLCRLFRTVVSQTHLQYAKIIEEKDRREKNKNKKKVIEYLKALQGRMALWTSRE